MSALCSIHGVPLSDWTLECPACEAEERRHDEALNAQRAQQESIERQTELLREAEEAEAERAIEAQWALDELAATAKARLREDRLHRQAEAERATLRAGVRELTPALQVKWQQACLGYEQVRASMKALQADKAAKASLISQFTTTASRELEQLVRREGEAVQRALSASGSSILASLPENRFAPVEEAGQLGDLIRHAVTTAEPFLSGRMVRTVEDPTLITSLWPALKTLEEAHAGVRAEDVKEWSMSSGPKWALGIATFVVLVLSLDALGEALFPDIRPSNTVANVLGAIVFVMLPFLSAVAAHAPELYLNRRVKPYKLFSDALAQLKAAIAKHAGSGTAQTLQNRLAKAFLLRTVENVSGNEAYLAALRNRSEAEEALERAVQAERDATPQHERTLKEYQFLRQEVMRVGREIVEGVRAPGRLLQATRCGQCGGPITSETNQCPYCRCGVAKVVDV